MKRLVPALKTVVVIAAMLLPPWNIFWWSIGLVMLAIAWISAKLLVPEENGRTEVMAAACYVALFAPLVLPKAICVAVAGGPKLLREHRARKHRQTAARLLQERLAAREFRCETIDTPRGAVIVTQLDDARREEFGDVYAEVINSFGRSKTPHVICDRDQPSPCFDRAWAEKHGFDDHVEDLPYEHCPECGVQTMKPFPEFAKAHTERTGRKSRKRQVTVVTKQEEKMDLLVSLCDDCLVLHRPDFVITKSSDTEAIDEEA